jgi:hypothetical protein
VTVCDVHIFGQQRIVSYQGCQQHLTQPVISDPAAKRGLGAQAMERQACIGHSAPERVPRWPDMRQSARTDQCRNRGMGRAQLRDNVDTDMSGDNHFNVGRAGHGETALVATK